MEASTTTEQDDDSDAHVVVEMREARLAGSGGDLDSVHVFESDAEAEAETASIDDDHDNYNHDFEGGDLSSAAVKIGGAGQYRHPYILEEGLNDDEDDDDDDEGRDGGGGNIVERPDPPGSTASLYNRQHHRHEEFNVFQEAPQSQQGQQTHQQQLLNADRRLRTQHQQRRWQDRFWLILNRLLRIITYPVTVTLTIVILILTLTLCVFPVVVLIVAVICLYYCAIEDPMPLHLLLRYMFTPEVDEAMGHYNRPEHTFVSRKSIASKLIVRRVLKITLRNGDNINNSNVDSDSDNKKRNTVDGAVYPRNHPFPIRLSTLYATLYFSQPIEGGGDDEDGDKRDDDNTHDIGDENDHGINVVSTVASMQTNNIPHDQLSFDQEATDDQLHQQRQLTVVTTSIIAARYNKEDEGGNNIGYTLESFEGIRDGCVVEDCDENIVHSCVAAGFDEDINDLAKMDSSPPNMNPTDITIPSSREEQKTIIDSDNQKKVASSLETDYFGIDGDCRDKGSSCGICLLSFEVRDVVAFSPNSDCSHHFHKDCILDWLQRKQTCPICRRDYLKWSKEDNV